MNSDEINRIEKRIVELKFLERDIMRERERARLPLLKNAEKCARVDDLTRKFFIRSMKLGLESLDITAYPSGFGGRNGDEFLSEVRVDITYRPEKRADYSELTLSVFLTDGFEDRSARETESNMMDRLFDLRESVEKLRDEKRRLKKGV